MQTAMNNVYRISGLPPAACLVVGQLVCVDGISGINGYREFNNPLELVNTMPG